MDSRSSSVPPAAASEALPEAPFSPRKEHTPQPVKHVGLSERVDSRASSVVDAAVARAASPAPFSPRKEHTPQPAKTVGLIERVDSRSSSVAPAAVAGEDIPEAPLSPRKRFPTPQLAQPFGEGEPEDTAEHMQAPFVSSAASDVAIEVAQDWNMSGFFGSPEEVRIAEGDEKGETETNPRSSTVSYSDKARTSGAPLTQTQSRSGLARVTEMPATLMTSTDRRQLSVFARQESAPEENTLFNHCPATIAFPLVVSILSAVICGLAFAALPHANPLHASSGSKWWHCALACAVVWSPLTVSYLWQLLLAIVYRPHGQNMDMKAVLLLYVCFAGSMVMAMFCTLGLWRNPSPVNGVSATLSGLGGASGMILFYIMPKLARSVEGESADAQSATRTRTMVGDLRWRGLLVIMFSLLSAVLLMAMLVWSSFLMWVDVWYVSILGIAVFRAIGCYIFELMASQYNSEASIIGVNVVMSSTGMANVLSIGSMGSWEFMFMLLAIDIMHILKRVGGLAGIEIRGVYISEILLDVPRWLKAKMRCPAGGVPPMDIFMLRASYQRQMSYLIAQEVGEVAVPLSYLSCWLIVVAGPNGASFSGVGTGDFGIDPPEDKASLIMMSAFLVVGNYISVLFLKVLVYRICKIDLEHEAKKLFLRFGGVLVAQTTWVIVTAFCMTMIQCGLDYSLRYEYLRSAAP